MAKTQKRSSEKRAIDTVFILLGITATVILLIASSLVWYGYRFATNTVKSELSAQKIYFPAIGSPGFDAAEFPGLQKYAGQQVNDGIKAKAYANEYIGVHLEKVANGKTYSEVSALAMKDPTNTKLAAQKQTLFQGETLRGILLGDGYAYWTFGLIAKYVAIALFVGSLVTASLVFVCMRHLDRLK
jgi:hypothetical protein